MMENKINFGRRVKLNNDVEMPTLGLGVWQISSGETEAARYFTLNLAAEALRNLCE